MCHLFLDVGTGMQLQRKKERGLHVSCYQIDSDPFGRLDILHCKVSGGQKLELFVARKFKKMEASKTTLNTKTAESPHYAIIWECTLTFLPLFGVCTKPS